MIGEYTLKTLCEKYKLNSDKIVNKNNNILKFGEYKDIDQTLNYLINELLIVPSNIEKCPSILYKNVGNIKQNVIFLKSQRIVFNNIESCLHVLSSEPDELIETYKYVKNNYGENVINKITSILSVPKKIIIDVEKLNIPFVNKTGNLSVAVGIEWGATELEEIQKIIQSPEFKAHPELFTSQTLAHAKLEEIQQLLRMEYWKDERFEKLLTSSIVAKSKSMISKLPILVQIAEDNGIDRYLNTSFLLFSPSQNYALIQYLNENHIPLIIDGKLNSIFGKQPGVLRKKYDIDINYLISKYPLEIDEIKGMKEGKRK